MRSVVFHLADDHMEKGLRAFFRRDNWHYAYVFLALRAECGRRQLKARAFGNSTPRLDVANVGSVLVPDLPSREGARLGSWARRVAQHRTTAV